MFLAKSVSSHSVSSMNPTSLLLRERSFKLFLGACRAGARRGAGRPSLKENGQSNTTGEECLKVFQTSSLTSRPWQTHSVSENNYKLSKKQDMLKLWIQSHLHHSEGQREYYGCLWRNDLIYGGNKCFLSNKSKSTVEPQALPNISL